MLAPDSRVCQLIKPTVESLGYELVAVEHFRQGDGSVLRIYIDVKPDMENDQDPQCCVTLDDCALVSEQLSALLVVEDPISGQYVLEVSSPGMDRPLVYPEHFARFLGARIRVKLAAKQNGRRNFDAQLTGYEDGEVHFIEGETEWQVPMAVVESVRLVPVFD